MSWGDQTFNPQLKWAPWAIGLLFFLAWELAARSGLISATWFPPPSEIGQTLASLIASGQLLTDISATLGRLLGGFLLGAIIGLGLGIYMGWSSAARQVIDPIIAALHPVPKISMFPLVMIVFGIGALSKTLVIAIAAFFPIVINTMAGVRQLHPIYFEVANNYGARPWQVFRHVILPGSSPMVLAGTRLALNLSLSITTSLELIMGRDGLGAMIWLSWQTLRVDELFAAVFCLALIGVGFRLIVNALARKLIPWQDAIANRN